MFYDYADCYPDSYPDDFTDRYYMISPISIHRWYSLISNLQPLISTIKQVLQLILSDR